MQKKILLLIGAVIVLILSYKFLPFPCNCTPEVSQTDAFGYRTEEIKLGDTTLSVEIADTDTLRTQGLSGRASLPENTGMLFVFQVPDIYAFWMKDMKFSLDLVWIDSGNKIIAVDSNLAPNTYPKVFLPPSHVVYVVELPAGFAQGHNVKVGENLSIGH